MRGVIRRTLPGHFLRRGFSSSAIRHEIRDVAALPRRLIPKYQGAALACEYWYAD